MSSHGSDHDDVPVESGSIDEIYLKKDGRVCIHNPEDHKFRFQWVESDNFVDLNEAR